MLTQAWPAMAAAICGIQILCLITVESLSEADKIQTLPGQPQVSFQQFGGYISVDEKQDRALFYYFAEAETDPASKPLVLWLTGGPGCSSVGAGAFCEHGPFKPSGQILVKNDYSWNKEANMLYLESPAGVGFSYSADASFYAGVDDNITARDNLVFLENWFNKFPKYKNRDFFIAGESYGGHFVPQLAQLIIQSKVQFNLKGIAIGNPLLEFNTDFNSRAEYYWSHGLVSDDTYELFNTVCNFSQIRRQADNNALTPVCSRVNSQARREMSKFIDEFDVTLDVCLSSVNSQAQVLSQLVRSFISSPYSFLVFLFLNSQARREMSKFIDGYDVTLDVCLSSVGLQAQVLSQLQQSTKIDVCIRDETTNYLNMEDVQKAFHARLVGVTRWSVCSDVLQYDMENLEIPMTPVLASLIKSGIRVLVYSGDQDSVIPLTGTRTLVNGLAKELALNTTVPYRVWFEGSQVGGWTQVYGDVLSFATIRGASHEPPFSQPERSLVLFDTFLGGKPLPQGVLAAETIHK